MPEHFDILWEDGRCLVVSKPGGILTQSPPGIDSLEIRVKEWIRSQADHEGRAYLGLPHRIDRPASGALLLARTRRAAQRLCQQFEDRTVEKTYWALVAGHVTPEAGTWRDSIRKVPDEARAELVSSDHPDGKAAVLHYQVLDRPVRSDWPDVSWLSITLETGRTHQIRVQAASRGFPILGDAQYGSAIPFGPQTDDPRKRWIALHARRIQFHHPSSHDRVRVSAPLPPWWTSP